MERSSVSPCRVLLLVLVSQIFLHDTVFGGRIRMPSERLGFDDGSVVRATQPLIGILTGEMDDMIGGFGTYHPGMSYIAASYVKFVESGGARAVPLLHNEPVESLRRVRIDDRPPISIASRLLCIITLLDIEKKYRIST